MTKEDQIHSILKFHCISISRYNHILNLVKDEYLCEREITNSYNRYNRFNTQHYGLCYALKEASKFTISSAEYHAVKTIFRDTFPPIRPNLYCWSRHLKEPRINYLKSIKL